MIGNEPQFDQFISEHRWAALTTLRSSGNPSTSLVAYAREDDSLVVSTPGTTFKRRSLDRDARLSLCIFSNAEPFNFVTVEGTAQIETDNLEASTRAVFKNIEGTGYALPDDLPSWLASQQRVIIRITPERVYGVIR